MKVKVTVAPGASLGKAQPDITKDKSTAPDEWETKQHMQDLIRAHEIMNDPVKMQAVHKLAGRHKKAISSIQDIKDYHQKKYGPKKPGLAQLANDDGPEDDEPGEGSESSSY